MGLGDGTRGDRAANGGKGEKGRITNTHQTPRVSPDRERRDALRTRPGQELTPGRRWPGGPPR